LKFRRAHLAYCTNIHPAGNWEETRHSLQTHTLGVRDLLKKQGMLPANEAFAIGLRLSARAAHELLQGDQLARFRDWLAATNTYVFTINGFPYGNFHGTRVKEQVFAPDWTHRDRVEYTKNLFKILSAIAPANSGGSVSTLPGSHKSFEADEAIIRKNLIELSTWLDDLSARTGKDLHLGLEPEPLGHIENTQESLAFFDRLANEAKDSETLLNRIGINYDCCHFALQFEDAKESLESLVKNKIRISKIHLSSALTLDPKNPAAIAAIAGFDEPVYSHQVIHQNKSGTLSRFIDLPDFLKATPSNLDGEARVHFHIPLDAMPSTPLGSTSDHVTETLSWLHAHPLTCTHLEIETYTWGVLPNELRRPVEEQIAAEYRWVLAQSM
jgi:sugar phosphate isomerase/epimerase